MLNVSNPPCYYCKDESHAMKDCPKFLDLRKQSDEVKKEWKNNHKCCPECGSMKINQTFSQIIYVLGHSYEDNINDASCNCGWNGMVKDLVGPKDKS